jgi:hypothetical protein
LIRIDGIKINYKQQSVKEKEVKMAFNEVNPLKHRINYNTKQNPPKRGIEDGSSVFSFDWCSGPVPGTITATILIPIII